MLAIKNWLSLSAKEKKQCLLRPIQNSSTKQKVIQILEQVKSCGDRALFELTEKYDGAALATLQVDRDTILKATIEQSSLNAINQAIQTITHYHMTQVPESTNIQTAKGITLFNTYRPIQKVGLYIPGGNKTPLISSLLMQAIPARVAGCPVKVLCTPPDNTGAINSHLLVAARLCGIDTIYTLGGAQAIAAMAYGTESIVKVDKIFGPGNSFVTEAKSIVASDPFGAAIDMPAGPSEVMILADEKANPAFLAADLLAQAEHGPDSQVYLICESLNSAEAVNQELTKQASVLSRNAIISQSLQNSMIIICPDRTDQITIINSYAPEHLIINREDASTWIDQINAAGTVFLGPWAAETMGDYVTGSNHVLPTNGYARNYNGLGTLDFLTRFTVQSIEKEGIKTLGPSAIALARIEGLDAHANAVQIRLDSLEI